MKGIYCLIIKVNKTIEVKIGALGSIVFKKGIFVYAGSAQNNLRKRVERHKSKEKKMRWHIDYLLANPHAEIERVFYKESCKDEECRIALELSKCEESIKGFGCSDCSCKSHLFRVDKERVLEKLNVLKMILYN